MGLKAIVEHYKKVYRPSAKGELEWFRSQPDLATAVDTAARAVNSKGKRYDHQHRIRKVAMPRAIRALGRAVAEVEKAASFDKLYGAVHAVVGSVDGIGPVYVYDTAFRIGAFRGLAPARVYLHAGTRVGARRLGLVTRGRAYVEVREVVAEAPEFEELSAGEMEDVLCIYKDKLRDQKAGTATFEPPGTSWCC